jgi:hypothetical protein
MLYSERGRRTTLSSVRAFALRCSALVPSADGGRRHCFYVVGDLLKRTSPDVVVGLLPCRRGMRVLNAARMMLFSSL